MSRLKSLFTSNIWMALILFYFSSPYFVWHIPFKNYINIFAIIILSFTCYKHRKKMVISDQILIFMYLITWVYYMIQLYFSGRNFFGLIENAPICLLCFVTIVRKDYGEKVLNQYVDIYSCVIFISILVWFASSLLPIPSTGMINHYGEMRQYDTYPFLVKERLVIDSFRFYGPFDEPGIVGTTGAMLLCLLKFDFKDKRTWIILLSGILSMSFFFYTVVAIYSVTYLCFVKNAIPQTVLIAIAFLLFYLLTKDHEILSKVIWARFEWDSDLGKFAGDNRTNDLANEYFNKIRGTSEYFFGVRNLEQYWSFAEGDSSYKNIIAMYGAIFLFMYCFYYILFAYSYRQTLFSFGLFCFFFLLNMYQRSNIYSTLWMFLYVALARGFSIKKSKE